MHFDRDHADYHNWTGRPFGRLFVVGPDFGSDAVIGFKSYSRLVLGIYVIANGVLGSLHFFSGFVFSNHTIIKALPDRSDSRIDVPQTCFESHVYFEIINSPARSFSVDLSFGTLVKVNPRCRSASRTQIRFLQTVV